MITRRSLADTIDAYDEQIADLNKSKRETFDAYRDQMVAALLTKPEIRAEIEAVKAAIKRRRESVKDEHALIEKDELIDEVFHEITRAPRATRENIEKFDAETGEIIDDGRSDAGLNIVTKHEDIQVSPETAREHPREAAEAGSESDGDAVGRPTSERQPETVGSEDGGVTGGESAATNPEKATVATQGEATAPTSDERVSLHDGSDAAANAGGIDVDRNAERVPTNTTGEGTALSALPIKTSIRPLCRNPGDACGGYGRKHCRACETAAAELEAAE